MGGNTTLTLTDTRCSTDALPSRKARDHRVSEGEAGTDDRDREPRAAVARTRGGSLSGRAAGFHPRTARVLRPGGLSDLTGTSLGRRSRVLPGCDRPAHEERSQVRFERLLCSGEYC